RERESLFPDRQISALQHFWNDVRAVLDFEVHECRSVVDLFVECWKFARFSLDVCELAVMPNRTHEKRLFELRRSVHELETAGGRLLVGGDRLSRMPVGHVNSRTSLRQLVMEFVDLRSAVVLRFRARAARVSVYVDLEIGRSAPVLLAEQER